MGDRLASVVLLACLGMVLTVRAGHCLAPVGPDTLAGACHVKTADGCPHLACPNTDRSHTTERCCWTSPDREPDLAILPAVRVQLFRAIAIVGSADSSAPRMHLPASSVREIPHPPTRAPDDLIPLHATYLL